MIEGHGDDAYRYDGIKSDFSSNICAHAAHHALMEHLAAHPELVSHYPEPEAWSLERMIAERLDVDPRCVIVTSGATEAIYLVAQTFRMKHVTPETSFSEYDDAIKLFPTEDSTLTARWICNPNNPTGCTVHRNVISSLAREYDLMVIDQSYEQYTSKPVMSARAAVRYGNIVQIHSMTKTYAVPGLRLGYIVAAPRLAAAIRRQMRPWSVSSIAIEAGRFLLQHDELVCQPDLDEAKRLRLRLMAIEGISVSPSDTNFMLCLLPSRTAAELKDYLAREHHILIRDASNFKGLSPRHFRIASQTPAENDSLVEAIHQFLTAQNG
jgi:threonine-phosphate decarboxylase